MSQLLSPISRQECGSVRAIGVNYADHAVRTPNGLTLTLTGRNGYPETYTTSHVLQIQPDNRTPQRASTGQ